MRCILHIGTEKTATTTLQQQLDVHRGALAAEGVAVTRSAGAGNNWRLAVAAYDDNRHDDLTVAAGVDDAASLRRMRSGLVADLAAELNDIAAAVDCNLDAVLFSSEHFQSRLTTVEEIERLAALLADIGVTSTRIVVYLRDPVSLAASLHSTLVKHGSTRRVPPPPAADTYYHHLCDHRGTIERWQAVFTHVTPRLFDEDSLTGGSIVTDFLTAVGLPSRTADTGAQQPHLNRSLSTAEVEVLSRINEHVPYTIDGEPNQRHTELVKALERHTAGPGYRLPPRLAERYRDTFAASNEWVRQRFFPEREYLFAAEHPDHEPTHTPPGYDGLAALLVELLDRPDQAGGAALS